MNYYNTYVSEMRLWIYNYWWLSIIYTNIYLLTVYYGQRYMADKNPLKLTLLLGVWNCLLSVFSVSGTIVLLPMLIDDIRNKGIVYSYCSTDYTYAYSGYWCSLFVISKAYELIDTIFIVLRKKELTFLHWYHHASVLMYSWYAAHNSTSTARWFVVMNYTVHSFMYIYYLLVILKVKVYRYIKIFITIIQIMQMLIGVLINTMALYAKYYNVDCQVTYTNICLSYLLYLSYAMLFIRYFYITYIVSDQHKQVKGWVTLRKFINN